MKNIQIDNTGFVNKGAELMLRAIVDKLDANDVNIVFNGSVRNASFKQKASLNLMSLVSLRRFKIDLSFLFPKNRFIASGLVFSKDIDVLLDAGGFHIGDQWIDKRSTKQEIDKLVSYYKNLKKKGIKIIFLPQALGAFDKEMSRYFFKKVYELSDLMIARDTQSYKYCEEVLSNSNKLFQYPDFTNIYKPKSLISNDFDKFSGKICIVPNYKMVSHTNNEIAQNYIDFLKRITDNLISKGEEVFYLNHEGKGDLDLIHKINTNKLDVVTNINADEVKYVIGKSKMLISSRFHGVVSGLSQAIPTFCTSWSHKYIELLSDYQFKEGLLSVDDVENAVVILNKYLEQDIRSALISHLKEKSEIEKKKTEEMWLKVNQLIC